MSKETNYRITSGGAGPFTQGEVVTAQQLKDNNMDPARLARLAALEETDDEATSVAEGGSLAAAFPAPVTDEQNKLAVEQRIQAETAARGRALPAHEQTRVAIETTQDSAARTAEAKEDASAKQLEANAEAAARDGTQPPPGEEDGAAAGGEEPAFAGRPLRFYDGKSDEDVLAVDGVGEATLKDIKAARRARDRRRK